MQNKTRPKISFKSKDIFQDLNYGFSIVHCISECASQSKGFARELVQRFPENLELIKDDLTTGMCYLKRVGLNSNILNLVTKESKNDKPTVQSLKKCLNHLLKICTQNKITEIKMPKIASGLDKIPWSEVFKLITCVFEKSNVYIDIYENE